jgi:DNA (cytosine-5)-methyltransferase 1
MSKKLTYIDLFAGCGGLSLGLHQAGWKGLFAIEKSPDAFKTLDYNLIQNKNHFDWPKWLPKGAHDINEVLYHYSDRLDSLKGKVTMIAGGPPCQGFSMAGRRDENDSRNDLINSYIKFVSTVEPKIIFFENVKGFTMEFKKNKDKGIAYSALVTKQLEELGYFVKGKLINFGDFGIPQKRTRFILVGLKKEFNNSSQDKVDNFFSSLEENKFNFLSEKKLNIKPTIKDALSDLLTLKDTVETPDRRGFKSSPYNRIKSDYQRYLRENCYHEVPNSHSLAKHSSLVIERLNYVLAISESCKNISKEIKETLGLKKQVLIPLKAKEQAPTITSHPDDLIHYCEPRILTVREYARIQSFPDWFEFKGKYTTGGKLRKFEVPRYTQIGNAIPPLFGEQSGLILKEFI